MSIKDKITRLEARTTRRRGFLAVEQAEDGTILHEGRPLSEEGLKALQEDHAVFAIREDG